VRQRAPAHEGLGHLADVERGQHARLDAQLLDRVRERERAVILAADDMKSKPENVREKMMGGRLNSFFAGCVLAEQPWIHDDKQSVGKALESALGAGTKIESFKRVHLGA